MNEWFLAMEVSSLSTLSSLPVSPKFISVSRAKVSPIRGFPLRAPWYFLLIALCVGHPYSACSVKSHRSQVLEGISFVSDVALSGAEGPS